ncbi:MAG: 3-hydroxyacyl-ACP dehydratase FabZ family protein [Acidobacteriota bacterium]
MRFILVDEIIELEPMKRILASKFVSGEEEYFVDHFPGYPVVPGVLLVEMIAQAAGRCLIAGIRPSLWPVFLQIRNAAFRKTVHPESLLMIEATIDTCNDRTSAARGRVLLQNETVAEASILLGFVPRSLLRADFEDPVLKRYFDKSDGVGLSQPG